MQLVKQSVTRFQLVELQIPANTPNNRINFVDQPNLRGRKIERIEWYDSAIVNPAPSGISTVLANASCFLTLSDENGFEFVAGIPIYELAALNQTFFSSTPFNGGLPLDPRVISFPKSYISFSSSSPVGTARSIIFGVYFK